MVYKIQEFQEENRYCMKAIYKASCNCVIKGGDDAKDESKKAQEDVPGAVFGQGRDSEQSLAKI